MMKCGHAANAIDDDGKPVCAICVGKEAIDIYENPTDIAGRKARCNYFGRGSLTIKKNNESLFGCINKRDCDCEVASSTNLPFFEHHPNREFDSFYCGCWSWE